jgi:2-dehydro-3-deoxyphosphogluconate aldolase/(4S)-4-hydroxy-2-oxoglutarate aldolase
MIEISNCLKAARVVPVATVQSVRDVEPLVGALFECGLCAIELTLRTPAALEVIREARRLAPRVLLGAGTVLTVAQADEVLAAGADFALAPGFDPDVVVHCRRAGLPFVPGVATASEIQRAWSLGCDVLKLFPAESLGGVNGFRTLVTPFRHLPLSFVPLGGITAPQLKRWLEQPAVAAVGGSWIADMPSIEAGRWAEIRTRAGEAAAMAGLSS